MYEVVSVAGNNAAPLWRSTLRVLACCVTIVKPSASTCAAAFCLLTISRRPARAWHSNLANCENGVVAAAISWSSICALIELPRCVPAAGMPRSLRGVAACHFLHRQLRALGISAVAAPTCAWREASPIVVAIGASSAAAACGVVAKRMLWVLSPDVLKWGGGDLRGVREMPNIRYLVMQCAIIKKHERSPSGPYISGPNI